MKLANLSKEELINEIQRLNNRVEDMDKEILDLRLKHMPVEAGNLYKEVFLDGVRVGVTIINKDKKIIYANRQAIEILQMNKNELLGRYSTDSIWNMVDEKGVLLEPEAQPSNITLRTGKPQNKVIRAIYADDPKKMRWLSIKTYAIFAPGHDKVNEVISTLIDITDQRIAEESLLHQIEFNDTLIGTANAMIVGLDERANITVFNNFSEIITGYKKKEVAAKNWFDMFISGADTKRVMKVFGDVWNGDNVHRGNENVVLCKDKNEKLIRWHNSMVKDNNGKTVSVLAIGVDITEEKKAKEEIQNKSEQIASQNAEYITLNKELRESNEKLENTIIKFKESEEKYRNLFEGVADALLVADLETHKLIDCNKQAQKLTGFTYKELMTLYAEDLHPQGLIEETMKIFKLQKEGKSIVVESEVLNRNGIRIPVEINAMIAVLKGRKVLMGVFRDITEQKEVLRLLRESETRFTAFMDNLPGAVFIRDDRSTALYVNEEMDKLFGARAWIGKDVYSVFSAEQADKFVADDQKALQEGFMKVIEKLTDVSGKEHVFETRKFAINRKDNAAWLGGIAMDITEKYQAEEDLKFSLQTSKDIVKSIPSGLFIFQFEKPDKLFLIDGNPESEKLTGIKVTEWLGKEFNEIWPDAKNTGMTLAYLKVVKTGETFKTEEQHYKDKRLKGAFRIHAFKIPGERLAVSFENITERKKYERELEKHKNHLEELVKKRTQEIEKRKVQLERMNKLFVGREFRIKELRDKVKELEEQLKLKF